MAGDITHLLVAHREGRPDALEQLVPLVYADLKQMARARMRGQAAGATLDTGALVHEAYLRLVDERRAEWQDRQHFFAVAAMAMRHIVIDHARKRSRAKRGGGEQLVSLGEVPETVAGDAAELLDLDRALTQLEATDPRAVRIVECRYFAGLSEEETSAAVGVSVRTVQREWLKARAWLRGALNARPAGSS